MIVVDASALLAILKREADWEKVHTRLIDRTEAAATHAVTLLEAVNGLARSEGRLVAEERVNRYLDRHTITTLPIDAEVGWLAREAYAQFGKGQGHPARLNLGDCFSHALAMKHGAVLLFVGDDFVAAGKSCALVAR